MLVSELPWIYRIAKECYCQNIIPILQTEKQLLQTTIEQNKMFRLEYHQIPNERVYECKKLSL
jgi:hypothetical protein